MRPLLATLAILVGTSACWTAAPPPEVTVANRAQPAAPKRHRCPQNRVTGVLYENHTDEPLIGATVVISGDGVPEDTDYDVALTDESGTFSVRRRKGTDTITVYYSDGTFRAALPAEPCDLAGRVSIGRSGNGEVMELQFDAPKRRK